MNIKYAERFVEFFFVGLIMGIIEDVIAVKAATNVQITWRMIGVIALVALPFAVFSEIIVDWKGIFGWFKKKVHKEEKVIQKEFKVIEQAAGIMPKDKKIKKRNADKGRFLP